MANATAITVTSLSENGAVAQPTADVLDTGTAAVTLDADIGGKAQHVILEVKNAAATAVNLTVEVLVGDNPPSQRAGVGSLSQVLAQNAIGILGPFDGMRFLQDNGKLSVKFTPASGTIGAQIRCYKLPKL